MMPHTDMGRLTQDIGAVEALEWLGASKKVRFDSTIPEGLTWADRMTSSMSSIP